MRRVQRLKDILNGTIMPGDLVFVASNNYLIGPYIFRSIGTSPHFISCNEYNCKRVDDNKKIYIHYFNQYLSRRFIKSNLDWLPQNSKDCYYKIKNSLNIEKLTEDYERKTYETNNTIQDTQQIREEPVLHSSDNSNLNVVGISESRLSASTMGDFDSHTSAYRQFFSIQSVGEIPNPVSNS